MRYALEWALSEVDDPTPQAPAGHVCGPDGGCDGKCLLRHDAAKNMEHARDVLARARDLRYRPKDRVRMAVDWAKTVCPGEQGTVQPCEACGGDPPCHGGFVEVLWDDGQRRGHAPEMLELVSRDVGHTGGRPKP